MPPVILAVEDNAVTSATIAREFSQSGFEVHIAASAEEAFDQLEGGLKCDMIILDFHLPLEQGPEFYRRLGMNPKYQSLAIIPFTSRIETSSSTSTCLTTDYASSLQADPKERERSPIVSKGFTDQLTRLPASLYVAVAETLRRQGVQWPAAFPLRMREAFAAMQQ